MHVACTEAAISVWLWSQLWRWPAVLRVYVLHCSWYLLSLFISEHGKFVGASGKFSSLSSWRRGQWLYPFLSPPSMFFLFILLLFHYCGIVLKSTGSESWREGSQHPIPQESVPEKDEDGRWFSLACQYFESLWYCDAVGYVTRRASRL